jgi:ankyrin repeat protein
VEILNYLLCHHSIQEDYSIQIAAENGSLEVLQLLLSRIKKFSLSLILTAKVGHLQTVKYLVNNGANVSENEYAALRLASEHGHLEVLLVYGGDQTAFNRSLSIAARLLLDSGVKISAGNTSPLRRAAQDGHWTATWRRIVE